jgi:spectrin beta
MSGYLYTDVINTPDEKSIMTYLVGYYHKFAQEANDSVGNKRLQKVIGFEMEITEEETHFELNSEGLAEWIETKIVELNSRTYVNSISGVQAALAEFKTYRTEEKPPRFLEKSNLEAQLFKIQMQLREANRNPWLVPEDRHVSAVNDGWIVLEKAEHEREVALREALARQEALAQMAARFGRKAGLREQWLRDMRDMLQRSQFGDDLPAVLAAAKKEDTIQLQITTYTERLQGRSSPN